MIHYENIFEESAFLDFSNIIQQNNSINADLQNLDNLLKVLDPKASKFSVKNHQLLDSRSLYACILYSLIKNIVKNHFKKPKELPQNVKQFTKNIECLIKNFYNSKSIYEDQKALLKQDRKIKYIVAEVLRHRATWSSTSHNDFKINPVKVEELRQLFEANSSKEMIKAFIEDLKAVVG